MHASAPEGTPEYFAQVEQSRYELEPFIPAYADFAGAAGKRVLEVGVGLGTDFVRFARAGADVTGVDLTEHAVELVRSRLEQEKLEGSVKVADAESLPFPDDLFDRVYSWGVLHHTPNTQRAIDEAIRVVRPGGALCVMLYGRHSWVTFGMWAKHGLLAGRPQRSLSDILAHHMESEGTKGYTKGELREMFRSLEQLQITPVATRYDSHFAGPLARLFPRFGWFMVIRGMKPA